MLDFFTHLFDPTGFPPRWNCGSWSTGHGWLHILSDLGVWSAYVAIPCVLLYFVWQRKNLPFRYIFVLFGAFILFCGTTHLMEAIIFWWPAYRLAGLIKLFTAVISWATVIALIPIAPRALAMKSPEDLERTVQERTAALHHEIAERKRAEEALRRERGILEVTLASIGDAVIATDAQGSVTFLNSIAERMTGWKTAEARGKPLAEVFNIINEQTRKSVENPCDKVLREGTIVGLANHTVLICADGSETPIDDSAAPIRDESGNVFGVVLVFRDASEQRRHVEAKERLAAIVENSHDAIIGNDLNGVITSWNKGAEALFGYATQEAIGRSIRLIVPPDHLNEATESLERVKRGEWVEHADTVRLRKDGSRIDVSSRISPIRNSEGEVVGAAKVSRDISERKQNEKSLLFLADAGAMLSALVDYESTMQRVARLAVPFFADYCVVDMVNEHGQIERVSHAHRSAEKEVVLKRALDRFPLDWNSPSVAVEVLRTRRPELISDFTPLQLDGMTIDDEQRQLIAELKPRSLIAVPIVIREKVVGVIQFVSSDSGRRYAAADLQLAMELAHRAGIAVENAKLYQELKEAQQQKDEFLAMLAHELRNPLAAIKYANQLAKIQGRAEDETEEIIDRQVTNLAHLIDDLLDVSRITRDKIQLQREMIDASTLVDRAVATVKQTVDARQQSFSVDCSKDPMPLDVDSTRIEQIFANLLSNAAKYTPEGGTIAVRCFRQDGQAVFQVRDSGVGIPSDMLPRVFDLFTQVDKSLDRSQGGLGIGLTVARKLAEMHGGSVTAKSEGLGSGSEFTVRLPISDKTLETKAPAAPVMRGSAPRKILVVDDNLDTARSIAALLRRAGHEVEIAHDGPTALKVARDFQPEAILLDIGLPIIDGYRVAETLRRESAFAKVLLIAISGYGQADDRKRSRAAGFDDHLIKPVDFRELLRILSESPAR